MAPKNKTQSAPTWCILNPNFSLTAEENAIINAHDALWKEHCEGGKMTDSLSIDSEFRSMEMDAAAGDLGALERLNKFGTPEALMRFRRAEQSGRRARFDADNCGLFLQVHPIASRLRGIFEKMLADYRAGGESERQLLGLSPIVNDDCTALLERQISALFAAESRTPAVFEVMANHVQLIEIEEDAQ